MRSCPTCFAPYAEQVDFCGLDGTKLATFEKDPLIGKTVERYRILAFIGDGGMARVYRARHETLDREYAIKVLFGEVASNKTLAERFRREAQAVSKIAHPNVVSVVDFGTTASGLTFLSMELIRGDTLRTEIKRRGRIPAARAINILRQITLGLNAAHEIGFVHRDLKPSNVMLTVHPDGEVAKLVDFGLVRATESDPEEGFLTKTGQFVGTPIYMSPEQIIGAEVDVKADFYALGVLLYEMLEGKPPFLAKKLALIRKKHLEEAPPKPRESGGLEILAVRLMEKTPEARPTGAEVIAALDGIAVDALGPEADAPDVPQDTALIERDPRLITHAEEARLSSSIGEVADEELSQVARPSKTPWALGGLAALVTVVIGFLMLPGVEPPEETPAPPPPPPAQAPVVTPPPKALKPPPPALPQVDPPAPEKVQIEPKRRVKKKRIPKPSRTSTKRLDAAVQKAAAARGLALADLDRLQDTRSAYRAYRRAKKKGRAEAEQSALLEAIRGATIEPSLVRAKLDRISKRLAAASSKVPLDELRKLEDRYLTIETAAQDLSGDRAESVLRKANRLLAAIAKAER